MFIYLLEKDLSDLEVNLKPIGTPREGGSQGASGGPGRGVLHRVDGPLFCLCLPGPSTNTVDSY